MRDRNTILNDLICVAKLNGAMGEYVARFKHLGQCSLYDNLLVAANTLGDQYKCLVEELKEEDEKPIKAEKVFTVVEDE